MENKNNNQLLLDPEKVFIGLINSEKYSQWETSERVKINKVAQGYNAKLANNKRSAIALGACSILLDLLTTGGITQILIEHQTKDMNIIITIFLCLLMFACKGVNYSLAYSNIANYIKNKNSIQTEKEKSLAEKENEFEQMKQLKRAELFNK